MPIYESANYKGNLWCAYELKRSDGTYNEEYRLKMRMESQELAFICPECGEHMMLCAGPIVEPYFRHYSDVDCPRSYLSGNSKSMTARRMIYSMLRRSFPEALIEPDKTLILEGNESVELRTDFLVTIYEKGNSQEVQLAVGYLSKPMKLSEWEERHLIYQSVGIEDAWFLEYGNFNTRVKTTFEYLISKYYPEMWYLNSLQNEIRVKEDVMPQKGNIKKSLSWRDDLSKFAINKDGTSRSGYAEYKQTQIDKIKNQFMQKERSLNYNMHETPAKHLLSAQNGMNIYRGCSHGCIYCDSRSLCYQKKYPFEEIEVKMNAPELLEQELRKKRRPCMIGTGAMCDPYLHLEEHLCLTRKCIELVKEYHCGLAIQTKSSRILRDLDLLKAINEESKCVVQITITTFDDKLCRIVEPNVSSTSERFEVLRVLQQNGIPTVVWLTPILPYINDTVENVTEILEKCGELGVYGIINMGMGLTLRDGDRQYYYEKLDEHFPGLKQRYMREYGNDYELPSPNWKELNEAYQRICMKYGMESDAGRVFDYMKTYKSKLDGEQLSLF